MPVQNLMQWGPGVAAWCCGLSQLRNVEDRVAMKPGLGESQVHQGSLMSCVAELGCVERGGECCCPSLEARLLGPCQETMGKLGAKPETVMLCFH